MGDDIEVLTRDYRFARQRYLSAKAERGDDEHVQRRPSALTVERLRVAYELAAIDLADAIAGPA